MASLEDVKSDLRLAAQFLVLHQVGDAELEAAQHAAEDAARMLAELRGRKGGER